MKRPVPVSCPCDRRPAGNTTRASATVELYPFNSIPTSDTAAQASSMFPATFMITEDDGLLELLRYNSYSGYTCNNPYHKTIGDRRSKIPDTSLELEKNSWLKSTCHGQ